VTSPELTENQLLAHLAPNVLSTIREHLEYVPLQFEKVLIEAATPVEYAYFPTGGILSAVAIMEDGDGIEVATIGNEGMLGVPGFTDIEISPYRVIVQGAGNAHRIRTDALKRQLKLHESFHDVLGRYQAAFLFQVSQCVACNGLHSVERRCCRWLLISHDRLGVDDLPLTHEFLALMLGVRRSSVTEIVQRLQRRGLITSHRGVITVLDRQALEAASCECYAAVQKEFRRLLG
jgi:CRP-like cAMP-binding protein